MSRLCRAEEVGYERCTAKVSRQVLRVRNLLADMWKAALM